METSNIFTLDSWSSPFTPCNSDDHDSNHFMTVPKAPHAPCPLNDGMPSSISEDPLRLALCLPHSNNLQALSVLEHIPGIEIVGVENQGAHDQKSIRESNGQDSLESSSTMLLHQTLPHVLLDFTSDLHTQSLTNQKQLGNTEIPGPYTASLVKKIVEHKHGLERQIAQIEKLANIGTLASGILHDINNPLYVVLGFSEILLEDNNSVAVKEQALEVFQATKRIIKMCEDLNSYARQHTPAEWIPVDLTVQLEEAMKVARFSVGLENMKIDRAYSTHPVIQARPEEIVQIFVNLIINALQAMDGQGTLTLGTGCTDLMATVSIGDTGPGIPQELMRKIFEPFYTTKPPGKGTGLGLHSVRSLVQKYGGQILIHSAVGEGSTFHLEFPVTSQRALSQNG
jgi:two-component system, NtrC family, sensor kinase